MRDPLPPVVLDCVLQDSSLVGRLARANAPYFPVQRYFANAAEMNALSKTQQGDGPAMRVGPVFRGDWAYDAPLVEGLDPIFQNPRFPTTGARHPPGAGEWMRFSRPRPSGRRRPGSSAPRSCGRRSSTRT